MCLLKATRTNPKWQENEKEDEKEEQWCKIQNESKARVCGENILELAGDAEDLLSVVLCMKKLKGETKTDNMPTVNKEVTEWRHTQRGIRAAVSAVSEDGLKTGIRSWLEGMQIDTERTKSAAIFHNQQREDESGLKLVGACWECLYELKPNFSSHNR